jgi:hypothetical protein
MAWLEMDLPNPGPDAFYAEEPAWERIIQQHIDRLAK